MLFYLYVLFVFVPSFSNALGSENYDFTFISATKVIYIHIDAIDYINKNFYLNRSIFGLGNASSDFEKSKIYVENLGMGEHPNKAISIQHANIVNIDSLII